MTEVVGKKRNFIGEFFAKMSPEEKKKFYADAKLKRQATIAAKASTVAKARIKAEEMLPELIAQDLLMAENDNYVPRQETLDRLRDLTNSGLTMEEMRKKYFKCMTDKSWQRLNKLLFKSHISQIEDIGLNILTKKREYIITLKARISELEEAIKKHRKKTKLFEPTSLLQMKAQAEERLYTLELDEMESFHKVGLVGEKSKAASINVHLSIPRPPPQTPKDVTPRTVSLSELVSDGPNDKL